VPGGKLARHVLDQLGIDGRSPPLAKARALPHQEAAFDVGSPTEVWGPNHRPGVDEQYADAT
jgi:hypothetical protein